MSIVFKSAILKLKYWILEGFMDEMFCDNSFLGVQFSSKESLENSSIKNDNLQEFKEYRFEWYGENKKIRTLSFFDVKYHIS